MKRLLSLLLTSVLAVMLIQITLPSAAQAEAPLMTWDATGIKGAQYTDIQCYGYWSTWRSPRLPLAGSWVYKSSGSPGVTPDYVGDVQCYITAYLKNGKIAYPAPVLWRFTTP